MTFQLQDTKFTSELAGLREDQKAFHSTTAKNQQAVIVQLTRFNDILEQRSAAQGPPAGAASSLQHLTHQCLSLSEDDRKRLIDSLK